MTSSIEIVNYPTITIPQFSFTHEGGFLDVLLTGHRDIGPQAIVRETSQDGLRVETYLLHQDTLLPLTTTRGSGRRSATFLLPLYRDDHLDFHNVPVTPTVIAETLHLRGPLGAAIESSVMDLRWRDGIFSTEVCYSGGWWRNLNEYVGMYVGGIAASSYDPHTQSLTGDNLGEVLNRARFRAPHVIPPSIADITDGITIIDRQTDEPYVAPDCPYSLDLFFWTLERLNVQGVIDIEGTVDVAGRFTWKDVGGDFTGKDELHAFVWDGSSPVATVRITGSISTHLCVERTTTASKTTLKLPVHLAAYLQPLTANIVEVAEVYDARFHRNL